MIVAGMVQVMIPVLLSVAVIGLWSTGLRRQGAAFWWKFLAAGLLAGALSAARLNAVLSFLGHFPRSEYLLPGAQSVTGALRLATESLFVRPAHEAAKTIFVNVQWRLDQHEWEYGVTFVPLALIA